MTDAEGQQTIASAKADAKVAVAEQRFDFVDSLNRRFQRYRSVAYRSGVILLSKIGITADIITNARLFLGILFIPLFLTHRLWAAVLMIGILFLDTVDGTLARHRNEASDRGKFLDVMVDHIVYSLTVGMLLFLPANPMFVVYNLFITPVVYLLATIKREEFKESDWLIKAYPRLSYLKGAVVLAFFAFVFFQVNVLDYALLFSNVVGTALAFYYYFYIQIRWKRVYG